MKWNYQHFGHLLKKLCVNGTAYLSINVDLFEKSLGKLFYNLLNEYLFHKKFLRY